jgi:beta-lactamase superfamily II metal-dependent hydrolase
MFLGGVDTLPSPIKQEDLVFHFLNVGFGDNIVVEFPVDKAGKRSYGIVDCRDFKKTKQYLDELMVVRPGRYELEFVCATHPHLDHIDGINSLLEDEKYRVKEFWDSGFRHKSQTYIKILKSLLLQGIELIRVSSGMEWYFGKVQVTALAPSILLRNKYATYGVDMNNASVVLRFEHHIEDVISGRSVEYTGSLSLETERQAGRSVVILSGDAEYDSWSRITEEFPRLERTDSNEPLVKKMVNYLACSALKVAHHGSMHSAPLDVYEKMMPEIAVISTEQETSTTQTGDLALTRGLFPHLLAITALRECGARILTTDGSYESGTEPAQKNPGSIVIVVPPGGKPRWAKLNDAATCTPKVLEKV